MVPDCAGKTKLYMQCSTRACATLIAFANDEPKQFSQGLLDFLWEVDIFKSIMFFLERFRGEESTSRLSYGDSMLSLLFAHCSANELLLERCRSWHEASWLLSSGIPWRWCVIAKELHQYICAHVYHRHVERCVETNHLTQSFRVEGDIYRECRLIDNCARLCYARPSFNNKKPREHPREKLAPLTSYLSFYNIRMATTLRNWWPWMILFFSYFDSLFHSTA